VKVIVIVVVLTEFYRIKGLRVNTTGWQHSNPSIFILPWNWGFPHGNYQHPTQRHFYTISKDQPGTQL